MSAQSPLYDNLISNGYDQYIPIFEYLEINTEDDLRKISDSMLMEYGYDKGPRLQILKVANDLLGMQLPYEDEMIYAFDVDGTLTPHPGMDLLSLWYLGPDRYYATLPIRQRDIMIRLLSLLPDSLILISRNNEQYVRRLFYLLNPEFEARIDKTYSCFRDAGPYPTDSSKRPALLNLSRLSKPIFYSDDSKEEIDKCLSVNNAYLGCYHARTWLGDPEELTNMGTMAIEFMTQISKYQRE